MFNKSILGIDFIGNILHIVELSFNKKTHYITNSFSIELCDLLSENNTQNIKQYGFNTNKAIIGIPTEDAIIIEINRKIAANCKIDHDLEELILEDVYDYLPEPIYNLNYDFIILDNLDDIVKIHHLLPKITIINTQPNSQKILFVAVKKDYLNHKLNTLSQCGVLVKVVDLTAFAIMRAENYSKKFIDTYQTALGLALGALC